jgi:hypothetical protein
MQAKLRLFYANDRGQIGVEQNAEHGQQMVYAVGEMGDRSFERPLIEKNLSFAVFCLNEKVGGVYIEMVQVLQYDRL